MKIIGFKDTIDWYDNNSKQYSDGLHTTFPTASFETFLKYIKSGDYVLEAGCGPGRETKQFSLRGIKTIGVDISEGLITIAKKNNPETEYILCNFLQLPFSKETFDGVWAHASLVHLETIDEVKQALKEFYRVLKKDGYVLIKVKEQVGNEKTAVVSDTLSKHERFFRYYSREEMMNLVTEAGFKIVDNLIQEDDHGRKEVSWIQIIAQKS